MIEVRITGWRDGLKKVQMTKEIRKYSGLGLAAGKKCTDGVLDGETVVVNVATESDAQALAAALASIGAIVELPNKTMSGESQDSNTLHE